MKTTTRLFSLFLAVVLLVSAIPMTAFAKGDVIYGVATVDASKLRLRSEASTSSKTLDTASRGEIVILVSKLDDWYKVIYNLQEGYMHSDYLDVQTAEDVELGYGKVNANKVNLRSGAGTSHKKVATADKGDKAYIIGVSGGWYKVIFGEKICYIRSDYLDLTEIPYENKGSSNKPLFFRDGKSTGTTPSAEALKGSTGSSVSDPGKTDDSGSNASGSTSGTTSAAVTSDGVKYGVAFVTGSGLRLRAKASTSSQTLASASKGEVVLVLSKEGEWYKVVYNRKEGYMHGDYLKVRTTENVELGYGTINANKVNLRSGAGTSNKKVDSGSKGEKAYVIGIAEGWYKVIFGENICYIRSDYLTLTEIPYENKASSKTPLFFRGGNSTGVSPSAGALNGTTGSADNSGNADTSGSTDSSGNSAASGSSGTANTPPASASGSKIVDTAKKYLGVPYVWGGASPSGFDCSGFVYYVLRSCGISVSRTSSSMYGQGTPVAKADLQPGDVVFFQNTYKAGISHVGIYVGGGQFIHSPHTGSVVSYADLNSTYYINHYYGAARFG
ncbi:MAG: SH3 domain-containing protein [Oscillospiraceae bacterium]|nr:SH3 domain-containing protein [Oscillospiraceae bacterium]